jgi:hypothetical protein
MRCLDHNDMAVMAGAVTTLAGAAFFFAWLGVERPPFAPAGETDAATFLAEQMDRSIAEALAAPAAAEEARASTQAALGRALVTLQQAKIREAAWIPELAAAARTAAEGRRLFLETRFKLPADWNGPEFAAMAREAETRAQPVLGRRIVTEGLAVASRLGAAEEAYGRSLVAAVGALDRAAREPAASQETLMAAARVAMREAERTAGRPSVEPRRTAGDGAEPMLLLGILGGVALLIGAGAAFLEHRGPGARRIEARCEEADRDVAVTMLTSGETPYEVAACTAFHDGPVTCGKRCLAWPTARAA